MRTNFRRSYASSPPARRFAGSLPPPGGAMSKPSIPGRRLSNGLPRSSSDAQEMEHMGATQAPAKRIAELTKVLAEASRAYYLKDAPLMSDAEYDRLFREL